jgi:SAM-dependent methyltransferase
MTATPAEDDRGYSVYTKSVLRIYDLWAVQFSGRLIWRCPAEYVLQVYNRHASANHLDVGVGTGFFLDRCRWPSARPRIALMDVNHHCLEVASRRLARYQPEIFRVNVLEPIQQPMKKFDSIGLSWLLHCLPGNIYTKASVFEHLKTVLNPGGVIFGATLLHDGVHHSAVSMRLMTLYNSRGILTNVHDDVEGLKTVLASTLSNVTVDIVGAAALFSGRV